MLPSITYNYVERLRALQLLRDGVSHVGIRQVDFGEPLDAVGKPPRCGARSSRAVYFGSGRLRSVLLDEGGA